MYDQALQQIIPKEVISDEGSAFWNKAEPELSAERKILKGGMWQPQAEWWDLPNFIKIFIGGYGAGKTNIGCKRIIAAALENAPVPVAAISPSFPMARQTVIVTIREFLQGKQSLYGKRFWWHYNASAKRFTIKFRGRTATIFIYSGDNPQALKGSNIAAAYIDEPFIQEEDVFRQILARVRHPNAVKPEIVITGTPEGISGWGYELCEGEEKARNDVGIVNAPTFMNKALDPKYVERLMQSYDEKSVQAYVMGRFVNTAGGLVYHGFDRGVNIKPNPMPDGAELGCGMDFNVNPFAFCVFWHKNSHIHVFAEYELPNADTDFACSILEEKHGRDLRYIYPDATGSRRQTSTPAGKSDHWQLERNGFIVLTRATNPRQKDRYNAVNGMLKPASGKPRLTIEPTCRKLIKYLSTYSYEQMNTKEQKGYSHLLDALGYPISYLYPVDKKSLDNTIRIVGY